MEDQRIKTLEDFKIYLLAERDRVNEQIGTYPPPIPACDAQFNYLLDERNRIANELKQIDAMLIKWASEGVKIEEIENLIASITHIDTKLVDKLRSTFTA